MGTESTFPGRCTRLFDGFLHFAEVTVRATPLLGESTVHLSEEAVGSLQQTFAEDADFLARHCVVAAVMVQLGWANIAGEMPLVGQTSFAVEVLAIRASGHAGRERSGFLLTVASMDAVAEYLLAFEHQCQSDRLNPHP